MKTLFLYLNAFSATGGIEKFNKAFMKALREISVEKELEFKILSAYDDKPDARYIDVKRFKGFKGNRIKFLAGTVKESRGAGKIFVGHINLAPVALLIKIFNPGVKLYVVAHGIEVWNKLSYLKKKILESAEGILAVSSFTKNKIVENQGIPPGKITIFPNTLDPYFKIPQRFEKPAYLLERYGIDKAAKVILTIARMSSMEGYKGYDIIINSLPSIAVQYPGIRYIIAGAYDIEEKNRIDRMIEKHKLRDIVLMPGFIKEEELADHYLLADLFAMPSIQEGFGIVFLEALACGLPVIAGNKDGSVDALKNGELGTLVDPDDSEEIKKAIINNLNQNIDKYFLYMKMIEAFRFEKFKGRLGEILKMYNFKKF